jgi:hypothetical protein
MLNLNAMFGSCESILESETPRRPVSSTELQMMEMEITADLAQAEVDSSKAATTTMQLDQVFNMYNHVKRFGIDRSFLSLYNSNNQLNSMLGVKFPSCESINSVGNANSNISRVFIVAMEDENEGIFAKIIKGIKWVWEKIKYLCTVVWKKIKSWIGLGTKKISHALDTVLNSKSKNKRKSTVKVLTNKKVVVGALATIAVISGIVIGYKSLKTPEQRKQAEDKLRKETSNLAEHGKDIKTETKEVSSVDEVKSNAKEEKQIMQELDKTTNNEDRVNKTMSGISDKIPAYDNFDEDTVPDVCRVYDSNDTDPASSAIVDFNASDTVISRLRKTNNPSRKQLKTNQNERLRQAKLILKVETTKKNVLYKITSALLTASLSQEEFCKLLEYSDDYSKQDKDKLAAAHKEILEHSSGNSSKKYADYVKHEDKIREILSNKGFSDLIS